MIFSDYVKLISQEMETDKNEDDEKKKKKRKEFLSFSGLIDNNCI